MTDAVIIAVAVLISTVTVGGLLKILQRMAVREFKAGVKDIVCDVLTDQLKPIKEDVAYCRNQLNYNGGQTVKDQVRKVVEKIEDLSEQVTDQTGHGK